MREVYLDNSSTTRPFDQVAERMSKVMTEQYGNPSSIHKMGIDAEKIMNEAKETLAAALGVKPGEVLFTSGGTESNNLAIKGIATKYRKRGSHIVTSAIEHRSVLNTMQDLEEDGFEVTYLPVNAKGQINPADLEEVISKDTILVSIMHANNETGVVQPLEKINDILIRQPIKPVFHVDAVQSFGKMPLVLFNTDIDLLTISAHKVHGPKGVGALFIREGINLEPLFLGGEKEKGRRSGTENVPGVAGFAEAIGLLFNKKEEEVHGIKGLRDNFVTQLQKKIPGIMINTPLEESVPHIVNITFPDIQAEVLLRNLESEDIYVSTSSACNSRKKRASHVLKAMGLTKDDVEGAIRFSLSVMNTQEDMEYCLEKIVPAYERLKKMVKF